MKKRLLLSLAAVIAIAAGIVGMSAFEAHVINVTATIENALTVPLDPIEFGTVFPQEELDSVISVAMSQSFIDEDRADDIDYVLKQKPKCVYDEALNANGSLNTDFHLPDDTELYGRVTESEGIFVCEDGDAYTMLPLLCPYLSKHDADPDDQNDGELDAFHGPITAGLDGWNPQTTEDLAVIGRLAKSQNDFADSWNIDLKVPCFYGQCAQDWNGFVTGINPGVANPGDYVQPAENEHAQFGCDLWLEVTSISRRIDPEMSILSLENKHGEGWFITADEIYGTLEFEPCGPDFNFNLTAQGLTANTDYSLIYYADGWPGNHPGALIWSGLTDGDGKVSVVDGSKNIETDIPNVDDDNIIHGGGKIWLIPSSAYDSGSKSVTTWPYDESWLFEHNLINYSLTCDVD